MKYKTIILASSRDLRNCPLSSSLATCLWPVLGTAVIERLLAGLSAQGVSDVVVCSNGCGSVIEATIDKTKCPSLTFLDEPFPVGTAGCVRDAVSGDALDTCQSLLVVFQGSMVSPPPIDELISAHKAGKSELTVFFNPDQQTASSSQFPATSSQRSADSNQLPAKSKQQKADSMQQIDKGEEGLASCVEQSEIPGLPREQPVASRSLQGAGVYVLNPSVLEHIPEIGYLDIKESLIPNLLAAGKKVHHARLPKNVHNFRSRNEYLLASADAFNSLDADGIEKYGLEKYNLKKHDNSDDVLVGTGVSIAPDARLVGPVAVLDGAQIAPGVVVLGPAVIGRNVVVGSGSVVVKSTLWDGALVGCGCRISESVIAANTVVEDDAVIENAAVAVRSGGFLERIMRKVSKGGTNKVIPKNSNAKKRKNAVSGSSRSAPLSVAKSEPVPGLRRGFYIGSSWQLIAVCCLLFASFLWSFWPNLKGLWDMWMVSDEFSSGVLVPLLAIYILWSRRDRLKGVPVQPAVWLGIAAFLFSQFVRLTGTFLMLSSLERFSIVLAVFSLVLLLCGWRVFWKVFSVLLFLLLMLPWPNQVQADITQPLQGWATESAVFSLEMIGYDVIREGNIIRIGDTTVAVAEACNGLRMITAFFVIIGLIVLLVDRPKWEKILVFASCLPIALLCNTIRLAITSVAFTYLKGPRWEGIFHDFGGYAMMPLALAIAVGELWLLKALTTPPKQLQHEVVEKNKSAGAQAPR